MKNHTEVEIPTALKCDFCSETALYDGRTKMVSWAYMCQLHFDKYGVGLGLGKGQKLIVKSE